MTKQEALQYFDLAENRKTVLVIGGSLGARTINQSIDAGIEKINVGNIQLVWQTGKGYFETAKQKANNSIKVFDFITCE